MTIRLGKSKSKRAGTCRFDYCGRVFGEDEWIVWHPQVVGATGASGGYICTPCGDKLVGEGHAKYYRKDGTEIPFKGSYTPDDTTITTAVTSSITESRVAAMLKPLQDKIAEIERKLADHWGYINQHGFDIMSLKQKLQTPAEKAADVFVGKSVELATEEIPF